MWQKLPELYARLFGGLLAGRKYFMYVEVQCNYVQYRALSAKPRYSIKGPAIMVFLYPVNSLKASPTMSFNLNGWMYVNGFRLFNELRTMGQFNSV